LRQQTEATHREKGLILRLVPGGTGFGAGPRPDDRSSTSHGAASRSHCEELVKGAQSAIMLELK